MFENIYNQIYYIGIQTMRYGKRFFKWLWALILRPLRTIATLFFTLIILIDKFALKTFHESVTEFKKLIDDAKNVSDKISEAKEEGRGKLLRRFLRYVKKAYGYVDSVEKGRGSAGGGNTGGYDNTKFPGWDPSKSPGENYEWRGRGDPISGKGAWVNKMTGETLHPDLNHKEPYGPHWDYNYPGGGNGFRIYPDGTMIPKMYEGDVLYA